VEVKQDCEGLKTLQEVEVELAVQILPGKMHGQGECWVAVEVLEDVVEVLGAQTMLLGGEVEPHDLEGHDLEVIAVVP